MTLSSGGPVLLPTLNSAQRFHSRWWTALPAIPTKRESAAYHRLWRQFADHTMNTFTVGEGGKVRPGNRGFYVEGREDHLVPAFFENFSMFSDFRWLELLLKRLEIPFKDRIKNAAWSYSYSEFLPSHGCRPHADIVLMWRDAAGVAVLAIEAKKPGFAGAGISPKDDPRNGYYLGYTAFHDVSREVDPGFWTGGLGGADAVPF
jgi:hypothetical protein